MGRGLGHGAAFVLVLAALGMLTTLVEGGQRVTVYSMRRLQEVIDEAQPGDIIDVDDREFRGPFLLNITASNITIQAAKPGRAFLNMGIQINITGSHVTFTGFQFTNGSLSGNLISVWWNTTRVTLSHLSFDGYRVDKYINLKGTFHRVAWCNFENKPEFPRGNLVHVDPGNEPNYNVIEYNKFHDLLGPGSDWGNEPIRLANEINWDKISRTVVQYNLFENTRWADSETISIKCAENIIRYNTFRENRDSQVVFRKTERSVAYGNFFINSGGIRIAEANDAYIYNNYWFNTTRTFEMMYYVGYMKNINIQHNTFVQAGAIQLRAMAENVMFANNVFYRTDQDNIFTGNANSTTFIGNLYKGHKGVKMPEGAGFVEGNALLEMGPDGWYQIQEGSPAIGAASDDPAIRPIIDIAGLNDPRLELDISGQPRKATGCCKDIGADEFSTAGIFNRPLRLSDVGPSYKRGDDPLLGVPPPSGSSGHPPHSSPADSSPAPQAPLPPSRSATTGGPTPTPSTNPDPPENGTGGRPHGGSALLPTLLLLSLSLLLLC